MALPLFFLEDGFDTTELVQSLADGNVVACAFPKEEIKHMSVLRISKGEHIAVADGRGLAIEAEYEGVPDKDFQGNAVWPGKGAELRLLRAIGEFPLPYRPNLTLVQGVSKGERMNLLTRQCVELGVRRIIPAMTARCIVKLEGDKRESRAERLRAIALSAAKQSGQPVVPEVLTPMDFDDAVEMAKNEADVIVIPWEESHDGSIADVLRDVPTDSNVFLFIGPEGGFEKYEVDSVVAIGGKVVSLGDTILRTETAGTIASALAIYELGGLGNSGRRING
ncbi:MAG: RsmE family RNA methyltransferase [Coriobacteriales bacterium]|jgi:16S rRNA (uracil1498-N3)-methyltransferase